MSERQYGLQWDEGEPVLTPWHGGGSFGLDGPMSLGEAQDQMVWFYRTRIENDTSSLASAESIVTCARCGGVIVTEWGEKCHLDEDDDDHEPETGE